MLAYAPSRRLCYGFDSRMDQGPGRMVDLSGVRRRPTPDKLRCMLDVRAAPLRNPGRRREKRFRAISRGGLRGGANKVVRRSWIWGL